MNCKDYEDPQLYRTVVRIRVKNAKDFIEKTFGNHHVVVYGDSTEDLKRLGNLFEMKVVEV